MARLPQSIRGFGVEADRGSVECGQVNGGFAGFAAGVGMPSVETVRKLWAAISSRAAQFLSLIGVGFSPVGTRNNPNEILAPPAVWPLVRGLIIPAALGNAARWKPRFSRIVYGHLFALRRLKPGPVKEYCHRDQRLFLGSNMGGGPVGFGLESLFFLLCFSTIPRCHDGEQGAFDLLEDVAHCVP